MMSNFEFTTTSSDARETKEQHRPTNRCWTTIRWVVAGFSLGFTVAFHYYNKSNNDSNNNNNPLAIIDHDEILSQENICNALYSCQKEHPERLAYGVPLFAGQAICNAHYRFGVTVAGVLQWHDCKTGEHRPILDPSAQEHNLLWEENDSLFFRMTENGTLQMLTTRHNNNQEDHDTVVYWEKVPTLAITPSRKCIKEHLMNCPYLHLHKGGGDVVLNSIDEEGEWSDRKIQKIYDDLYHDPCDFDA